MTKINSLSPEDLYQKCDPQLLGFETTDELEELAEVLSQARAMDAIRFGTGIQYEGYNLFVLGPHGTGKHSLVTRFLEQKAATEPAPDDVCYVNNFEEPHKPSALHLPPGMGVKLRTDMKRLVEDLGNVIPAAFESDEYRARRQEFEEEYKERQEKAFEELREEAEQRDIALVHTPSGLTFAPKRGEHVVNADEFEEWPEEKKKKTKVVIDVLQERLESIIRQLPKWRKENQERIKALNREVAMSAVDQNINELRTAYANEPCILNYLEVVQNNVIEQVDEFRRSEQEAPSLLGLPFPVPTDSTPHLHRYQVNVLIDHSDSKTAPVIYENNPTYQNLVGRVEHLAHMGALVTDFSLIKPGALHRANGGYLILDAYKLLTQPYAWEGLKRALTARIIRIESLGQALSLISTVSLEPEPVPLNIKVVLLGERLVYYLLHYFDPEFSKLFKVAVDFDEQIDRNPESQLFYAKMIGTLAKQHHLHPLDRQAVARVIEHSARLVADAEKLSTHMGSLTDLLCEADFWASESKNSVITADAVQQAINARIQRSDRVQNRLQEDIQRGTILIDTSGGKLGQVNGLSVIQLGDFAFGHPSRITARVRLGKGDVIDIEREVELSGPIHSKGVLILSGFLGARYAPYVPLSLSASLVFEQTYGGVEGDSASSAELYALLSSLSDLPIRQFLAVTGSVNQQGDVQSIGGVNEKIEGFFDICKTRGLTGEQGVLIPASNVKHLMLRQDVIDAVAADLFHIYPVDHVDQGIEILTGVPAGERDTNEIFPKDSVNGRIEERLLAMAEQTRLFAAAKTEEEPAQ